MNYWPRWIGAIRKRTSDLSLMEMGAYDRLLDHYYAEEKPLPGDLARCCRLAGATTKAEVEAVRYVIEKFFVLGDDGFRNARADDELVIGRKKIAAAQANGKSGGRPKGSRNKPNNEPRKEPGGFPEITQDEPGAKAPHHQSNTVPFETSSAHRAREPDDPKPEDPPDPPPPAPPDPPPDPPPKPPPFAPTKAGDVGKALKAAGMDPTQINLADPEVAELIRQGATPEEFGGIAKEALSKKVESPMRWVCVVLRRRREEAAKLALAPKVEKPWHETRSGIEAKGRELGLGTWDEHAAQRGRGEQWTAYQAKVFKAAGVPQQRGA